ncbi:MAG: hypothetical protein H0W34_09125 [Pyrinomonadaceae bacterium]|nr:hypothetical protein [Pyrinomonadaceae bacterium]
MAKSKAKRFQSGGEIMKKYVPGYERRQRSQHSEVHGQVNGKGNGVIEDALLQDLQSQLSSIDFTPVN